MKVAQVMSKKNKSKSVEVWGEEQVQKHKSLPHQRRNPEPLKLGPDEVIGHYSNRRLNTFNARLPGSVSEIYSRKLRWQREKPDKTECQTRQLSSAELAELLADPYALIPESAPAAEPTTPQPKVAQRAIRPKPKAVHQPGPPRDARELRFCSELATAIGGKTEQWNEAGRVDVLTDSYVIEVKQARNWKHAIGQVLVYASYYPDKAPVVYLIGDDVANYTTVAQQHCNRFGIRLETQANARLEATTRPRWFAYHPGALPGRTTQVREAD